MSSPSSSSLSSLAGRPTPELEEGHLILTTYDTSSSIDSCAVQIDNCRDVSSGAGSSDVSMGDEEESISPPSSVRNDMISFEPSGISKGLPPDALPNYTTRELVNIEEKRPIIRAPSLISSENRQVADLGKYIHDCYYDSGYPYRRPSRTVGGRPIFNQQPGCYKPQLQQSQVNYIILYAGCFNPPHQSHWALLNRAFECCQDLNIVAAIVVLCSGSSKLYGEEMALKKNQKARLWLGDQLHDWIWVFEQSTDSWDSFRGRLTYAASRDGFALDFIFLSGPDHVNTDDVISSWDCKNLIVSDVGREANFVRPGGAYLTLDGYSSWRTLRPDKKELVQKATETAMWLLSSISFKPRPPPVAQ
ncbi:hypothetical protein F5Y04DRAFT_291840 [Hypomontagnella monticulosa]|nr:hypothetical protein F5Y04DRAFT_291840 [Hypomontagnella monticulosa]